MPFPPSLPILDKTKIKKSFGNASKTYDNVAQLQRKIGSKLLQQFLSQNLSGNVLDVGCGTGFLTQQLSPYCEHLIALDLAFPMLQMTREKLNTQPNYVCADAENLPFSTQSIDTIFSNVALQWCIPIDKALNELHRVLKNDGKLVFSTFGLQTLHELKTAWKSVDNFSHVNHFYHESELKIALEKAGFTEIEIQKQLYISYYDSVLDLMRELKNIGAHNVNSQRSKNLTAKKSLEVMIENYPRNESGEILATFDVICIVARR